MLIIIIIIEKTSQILLHLIQHAAAYIDLNQKLTFCLNENEKSKILSEVQNKTENKIKNETLSKTLY